MTVRELIAELQQYDPEREVVLSKDAEGNAYRRARVVDTGLFNEDEESLGIEKLTPELIEQGYSEEDVGTGIPAICIWP